MIHTTVELDGWWGNKSALIKRGTLLYKLKKRFIHTLKTHKIEHIDRPNGVPHVALTTDASPCNETCYNAVQNVPITLTEENIVLYDDHAEISFGINTLHVQNVHMTLFFQKQLKAKHEQIVQEVYRQVLKSLQESPELAEDTILNEFEIQLDKKHTKQQYKGNKRSNKHSHDQQPQNKPEIDVEKISAQLEITNQLLQKILDSQKTIK